jgi:hypothetical protein
MPNYLIGVLAQKNNVIGEGSNACNISTTFFNEIYFTPFPIISVNACNIDVSIMNVIFNI